MEGKALLMNYLGGLEAVPLCIDNRDELGRKSFTGSGVGLLVLFRTNRNLRENLAILVSVYVLGVILGALCGPLIA